MYIVELPSFDTGDKSRRHNKFWDIMLIAFKKELPTACSNNLWVHFNAETNFGYFQINGLPVTFSLWCSQEDSDHILQILGWDGKAIPSRCIVLHLNKKDVGKK